ncbi:MAG: hypothetical protein JGK29_07745 [Microcoleus sp. PH2017_17_BER_D_A]|uniref:hypothetical protein n=1 Tax=Microcoleus sp. PH2017_16_JOR_D_A TaxID=2798827 RepID=UPI001DB8499A|nr:hypothetical protein [Microcoleus sp. PH2017_16_JOR_D_A]MCC3509012.1 hypothetical protein [Microcoleus sp. PH2017_17_BER_D_A]
MVESPPAGAGEIKIRLFITPILFVLGQLSTVNCQLSTVVVRYLPTSCDWLAAAYSRIFSCFGRYDKIDTSSKIGESDDKF